MKISSTDAAATLGVSEHKLFKAKRELGFIPGCTLDTSDMEKIKGVVEKKVRTGGRQNPNFPEYYKTVIGIIEKEGYITNYNLIKEFKVTHGVHVEAYFEAQKNPLYDEWIQPTKAHDKKNNYSKHKMKIWKLLNPVFDEWKQEAKIVNVYSNNYVGNMTGRLF